jgi:hypothetical protein
MYGREIVCINRSLEKEQRLTFVAKSSQSTNRPQILETFGGFIDSIENSILAKFQYTVLQFLWCKGVKITKKEMNFLSCCLHKNLS